MIKYRSYAGVVELADTLGSDGSAACGGVKRPERVAAVGVQRSCAVSKAHTGHRNRNESTRNVSTPKFPRHCEGIYALWQSVSFELFLYDVT